MKLHDLRPAQGSNTAKTRVGRGIAGGKGKTAGRGTKGQKARAGGSIPPWFEGGQTPIHVRIPKLRGFRNRGRVEYEVVNIGRIAQLIELGALEAGEMPGARPSRSGAAAPITVNQEILRATGLVSTLSKPLKVLGHGEISTPLFVVADAFSKSAISKIEAAGGSVQVLEVPAAPTAPLVDAAASATSGRAPSRASIRAQAAEKVRAEHAASAAAALARRSAAATVPAEAPAAKAKAPAAKKAAEAPAAKAKAPTARKAAEAPAAKAAAKRPARKESGPDAGGAG
jgi:large subunit ribosomal protein L15